MKHYLEHLNIDEYSIVPKYRQLISTINTGIEKGEIVKDDLLPSIHDLCVALDLSKNSVEKAYNALKKSGTVASIPGKGYFIAKDQLDLPLKVLLLFNKLSNHKKIIYDAFCNELGSRAEIDFYIYNNDYRVFKKLLLGKHDQYDKVVVIPHFSENSPSPAELLNRVPKEKLILVDKLVHGVKGDFSAVYEDFESDIYSALKKMLHKLVHYPVLTLVFPEHSYFAKEIIKGFKNFCYQYAFTYRIIKDPDDADLEPGHLYILLIEDHLVEIIEKILKTKLVVGKDIGLISYNETPLKKFILNGITTISTDFEMMGKLAAERVLDDLVKHISIPFYVHLRGSI